MKPNLIPLVWDDGRIGSVAADAEGILRLRHAIDSEMELEFELAKGASKLPSMAPPFHAAPRIDAVELTALIDELERYRK
ncbi:MAG TPA: hypothetical protein VHH12_04035 [Mycobacterium sp.]|nr:hypothetical protein [Mycobacterium sp.]